MRRIAFGAYVVANKWDFRCTRTDGSLGRTRRSIQQWQIVTGNEKAAHAEAARVQMQYPGIEANVYRCKIVLGKRVSAATPRAPRPRRKGQKSARGNRAKEVR